MAYALCVAMTSIGVPSVCRPSCEQISSAVYCRGNTLCMLSKVAVQEAYKLSRFPGSWRTVCIACRTDSCKTWQRLQVMADLCCRCEQYDSANFVVVIPALCY